MAKADLKNIALCHLINECGRLDHTAASVLQAYAEILAREANAEVSRTRIPDT